MRNYLMQDIQHSDNKAELHIQRVLGRIDGMKLVINDEEVLRIISIIEGWLTENEENHNDTSFKNV